MRKRTLRSRGLSIGRIIFLLMLLFTGARMLAQEKQITGRVVANDNDGAIPGASISIKGTRTSIATGADGAFKLTAAGNATLVVTAIGYAAQDVPVNGRDVIEVRLTPDPKSL